MANKSKVKKVITTLALLGVAAGAIFGGYKIADSLGAFNNDPQTQQLNIVENVTYDENNYIFSWDAVENADAYVASINGEEKQVDTNAYFYIPTEDVTEFKVKAIDTTGEYEDSKWSEVYTYNVQEADNLYSNVNVFVNDLLPGKELKEIIGMYADGNNLYTQVVCEYNGQSYFHNIRTQYETEITSIKQALELDNSKTYVGSGKSIVDYNSAEYLLKSNSLTGSLEAYRQEGYKISVVSSQTVQMEGYSEGSVFIIQGTYRLEKDGDVKYVQATFQCDINNPSSNPAVNYTTKLENSEDRYLSQMAFHELTGDFAEFAQEMEKANGTASTYFGYAINYSTSDDMSY